MTLAVTQLIGFGGFTESAGATGCDLTAASNSIYVGYGSATHPFGGAAPFGSISQEPYPGQVIKYIATSDSGKGIVLSVAFDGDIAATLSGVTKIVVDAVEYTLSAWWDGSGTTSATVFPYTPGMFVSTTVYAIDFA